MVTMSIMTLVLLKNLIRSQHCCTGKFQLFLPIITLWWTLASTRVEGQKARQSALIPTAEEHVAIVMPPVYFKTVNFGTVIHPVLCRIFTDLRL
jgi:hypothetical protein